VIAKEAAAVLPPPGLLQLAGGEAPDNAALSLRLRLAASSPAAAVFDPTALDCRSFAVASGWLLLMCGKPVLRASWAL
jgi:hypothetical protein